MIRYLDRDPDKDVTVVREMILRLQSAFHSGNLLWELHFEHGRARWAISFLAS